MVESTEYLDEITIDLEAVKPQIRLAVDNLFEHGYNDELVPFFSEDFGCDALNQSSLLDHQYPGYCDYIFYMAGLGGYQHFLRTQDHAEIAKYVMDYIFSKLNKANQKERKDIIENTFFYLFGNFYNQFSHTEDFPPIQIIEYLPLGEKIELLLKLEKIDDMQQLFEATACKVFDQICYQCKRIGSVEGNVDVEGEVLGLDKVSKIALLRVLKILTDKGYEMSFYGKEALKNIGEHSEDAFFMIYLDFLQNQWEFDLGWEYENSVCALVSPGKDFQQISSDYCASFSSSKRIINHPYMSGSTKTEMISPAPDFIVPAGKNGVSSMKKRYELALILEAFNPEKIISGGFWEAIMEFLDSRDIDVPDSFKHVELKLKEGLMSLREKEALLYTKEQFFQEKKRVVEVFREVFLRDFPSSQLGGDASVLEELKGLSLQSFMNRVLMFLQNSQVDLVMKKTKRASSEVVERDTSIPSPFVCSDAEVIIPTLIPTKKLHTPQLNEFIINQQKLFDECSKALGDIEISLSEGEKERLGIESYLEDLDKEFWDYGLYPKDITTFLEEVQRSDDLGEIKFSEYQDIISAENPFNQDDTTDLTIMMQELHNPYLRQKIEEALGISLSEIPLRTQMFLLHFLLNEPMETLKELKLVLGNAHSDDLKNNILYSFLLCYKNPQYAKCILWLGRGSMYAEKVFSHLAEILSITENTIPPSANKEAYSSAVVKRSFKFLMSFIDYCADWYDLILEEQMKVFQKDAIAWGAMLKAVSSSPNNERVSVEELKDVYDVDLKIEKGGEDIFSEEDLAMIHQNLDSSLANVDPEWLNYLKEGLLGDMESSDVKFITLRNNNKELAGLCKYRETEDSGVYYFGTMYVDKPYQKDFGIGGLLQEAVLSQLPSGSKLIASVAKENPAIVSHLKRGWVITGIIREGESEDLYKIEYDPSIKRSEKGRVVEIDINDFDGLAELSRGGIPIVGIEPSGSSKEKWSICLGES